MSKNTKEEPNAQLHDRLTGQNFVEYSCRSWSRRRTEMRSFTID